MKSLAVAIGVLVVSVGISTAQPYGLDTPQPVGPYLNNTFPPTAPSSSASWHVEIAFTNVLFNQPMFLLPYPGTNRLVILHKPGTISTFPNRPNVTQGELLPFLDISERTFTVSDSGLTGMAFHPEFGQPGSTNRGFVYITYKWRPPASGSINSEYAYLRLSRFTVPDGQISADPNSEVVLVQTFDRQMFHDAGCVIFGADGYLYFSIGDEGGANDQFNSTQTINERLMSGIFRIDVNQNPTTSHPIRRQQFRHPATPASWPDSFQTNYFVPNDNPFANPDGSVLEEFYALGFRQPYRFSQDPVTGLIWVADSGQSTKEEVNILVPGANYQWAYREGTVAGPKAPPAITNGFEKGPLWDYGRAEGGAAIGGYVYRGVEHAGFLTGKYILVDNVSSRIWALTSDGTTLTNVDYLTSMPSGSVYGGTSSCGVDHQGEIYFLKFGGTDGQRIFKLARSTVVVPDPPALLSQVGAFTNLATLAPAPGLIPYDVNAPLWSDAADKYRWLAIPNDGTHNTAAEKINFSPTNEWQFPAGSVFVKHFQLPADETNPNAVHRLETRFLIRDENGGVYGVTYKWRADGSDADLLPGGAEQEYLINTTSGVRTQLWTFPSRLDCISCHNANAKGVLGLKTHQLNGDTHYPLTGRTDNQLRTLGHLGMFSSDYQEAALATYLKSFDLDATTQPIVTRVRSYLDSNCAHCHRPGGQRANFDARFTTPLEQQSLIYGAVVTSVNDENDRVIVPQDLLHSLIHNRASRVGTLQMPPLAKNLVDSNAVALIATWINSLPTGPGVALSRTNATPLVFGAFPVHVDFTEPVTGVLSSHFLVSNGQVTSLSGSGANYTVLITPQVKGPVTVQFAGNKVTGGSDAGNYPSNPLTVSFDPLNEFLSTWLPFEEGAGPVAEDQSGNENSGTLVGMAASSWTTGLAGNALTFDGVNDYVRINNHLGASFTISCWIKTTQTFQPVTPTYEGTGIIWSDVGGSANDFILGGTRSAGGVNRLSFFVGSGNFTTTGTLPINSGQWMHVAATRNGATGEVRLYVNGVLDGTATGGTAVLNSNPEIHIGGNTLDNRYFNGAIDDVRFYSRVLTEVEIASLLPSTAPTVILTTATNTVPNSFVVTATFSEVVSAFAVNDVEVVNGFAGALTGNGGIYSFTVTPNTPGPVTVRIPANRAWDNDNNGNIAAPDLVVTAVDAAVPLLGLVGYWTFNETNSGTAFDSSTAGNHGALVNLNQVNRVPGVWGSGLFFNGTNGYVAVSNNLGDDFSLSLWVKTTQVFQQTDQTFNGTGIIWSDVAGGANDFILGGTRSGGGVNRLSFFTGNPDSSLNGTRNISEDKWTHLAAVRIKATGERRIYVNGILEATSTGGVNTLTANPAIHIGGNTLGGRYFLGLMDEVRAYNRALSDGEVAALAAAGGYQSWTLATMPTNSAAQIDPWLDLDGDGQVNLLEFAFNTNPLAAGESPFTISRAGDGSLWLTYPRRTGISGLRYTIWKSDDLLAWTPVTNEEVIEEMTQPVPGQPVELVWNRIVSATAGAFFRIEITWLAP
jgi:uncharacterized repeat protein (TIGR03806 family)